MKTIGTGDAPCGNCGKHIWNIPIILESVESDGNGGHWYKTDGGSCSECGEPLNYYHVSAPITVTFSKRFHEVARCN